MDGEFGFESYYRMSNAPEVIDMVDREKDGLGKIS